MVTTGIPWRHWRGGTIHNISRYWYNWWYGHDLYGTEGDPFLPIVKDSLRAHPGPLLDAACGFGNTYLDGTHLEDSVGLDIDPTVVTRNKLHRDFIVADLHSFRADRRFSLILSLYTWEHLHDPETVLRHFRGVLAANGVIVIVAPQRWHWVAILARTFPTRLQNLCWRILKHRDHMPYPVFFRTCTRKSLAETAARTGFTVERFESTEQPPIWLARIPPLFILACGWMSLVNRFRVFAGIRSTFLAVLRHVTPSRSAV